MRSIALILALAMVAGCGSKLDKLAASEKDHYYALKVYMDEKQDKAYFKLKTEEERNAYLKELGLWDNFYQYNQYERDDILAGEVTTGWTEDKVFMAWGAPIERRRLTGRPAERSELFVYRFEVDDEGYIRVYVPESKTAYKAAKRFQRELYIDDRVVTEILDKDGWE